MPKAENKIKIKVFFRNCCVFGSKALCVMVASITRLSIKVFSLITLIKMALKVVNAHHAQNRNNIDIFKNILYNDAQLNSTQ